MAGPAVLPVTPPCHLPLFCHPGRSGLAEGRPAGQTDGEPERAPLSQGALDPNRAVRPLRQLRCGARTRALAWDTDEKDGWKGRRTLEAAAYRLYEEGLRPILVRNPSKPHSGHLWVLLARPTDARRAQLAAEVLATITERFPDPREKTGARIRFPAGTYRPEEGEPVPVLVGAVTGVCEIQWHEGNAPAAWAALTNSLSNPDILETT